MADERERSPTRPELVQAVRDANRRVRVLGETSKGGPDEPRYGASYHAAVARDRAASKLKEADARERRRLRQHTDASN